MGIKHKTPKVSGEKGFAAEWNDEHLIDSDINFNLFSGINVGEPISPSDIATKNYVDMMAEGVPERGLVKSELFTNITNTLSEIEVGDKIFIWVKGSNRRKAGAREESTFLRIDGVIVDSIIASSEGSAINYVFALGTIHTATSSSHVLDIISGHGAPENVRIIVQVYRAGIVAVEGKHIEAGINNSDSSGRLTVTFYSAFSATPAVVATPQGTSSNYNIRITSVSTTSVTFQTSILGVVTIHWIVMDQG